MHLHIYCNYECLWLYILNLPVNWCNTMPLQKFIRLTEMLTAKESTVGGELVMDEALSKSNDLDCPT